MCPAARPVWSASSSARLRRCPADLHHRPLHQHQRGIEIQVVPAQRDHLATAKSCGDHQQIEREEPVVVHVGEEPAHLLRRPHVRGCALVHFRLEFDAQARIAGEQTLPHRLVERDAQRREDAPGCRDPDSALLAELAQRAFDLRAVQGCQLDIADPRREVLVDVALVAAAGAGPQVAFAGEPFGEIGAHGQTCRIHVAVRGNLLRHRGVRPLGIAFGGVAAAALLPPVPLGVWWQLDDVVPAAVPAVAQQRTRLSQRPTVRALAIASLVGRPAHTDSSRRGSVSAAFDAPGRFGGSLWKTAGWVTQQLHQRCGWDADAPSDPDDRRRPGAAPDEAVGACAADAQECRSGHQIQGRRKLIERVVPSPPPACIGRAGGNVEQGKCFGGHGPPISTGRSRGRGPGRRG